MIGIIISERSQNRKHDRHKNDQRDHSGNWNQHKVRECSAPLNPTGLHLDFPGFIQLPPQLISIPNIPDEDADKNQKPHQCENPVDEQQRGMVPAYPRGRAKRDQPPHSFGKVSAVSANGKMINFTGKPVEPVP